MRIDRKGIRRFFRYISFGVSTFFLDLFLLWLCIEIFLWHYVFSAGISFFIAVSLNYFLSRKYVFLETKRSLRRGYIYFLSIAFLGMVFVIGSMIFFVEFFKADPFVSRIGVASIVGFWNYFMNLYINFKIATLKI
ncbi:MAG: hypothetical protein EOM19_00635 [Candidatus Moranbacteria bacterium]|nr:hypothetical protein [Candidatus Moranbacteria bacterium]